MDEYYDILNFDNLIGGWDTVNRAINYLEKLSNAIDLFDENTRAAFKDIAAQLGPLNKELNAGSREAGQAIGALDSKLKAIGNTNKDAIKAFNDLVRASKNFDNELRNLGSELSSGVVKGIEELRTYLTGLINTYNKLGEEDRRTAQQLLHDLDEIERGAGSLETVQSKVIELSMAWEATQRGAKVATDMFNQVSEAQERWANSMQRLTEQDTIAADSLRGLNMQLGSLIEEYQLFSAAEREASGVEQLEKIKQKVLELKNVESVLRDALNPRAGDKFTLIEQLTANIEALENYKAQVPKLVADLEQQIAETNRSIMFNENVQGVGTNIGGYNTGALENMREHAKKLTEDLAGVINAETEHKHSIEELIKIDDLAGKSMKELETVVSALGTAYKLLKGEALNEFGPQMLESIVKTTEVLDGLKAKMDAVLHPKQEPSAGSIDYYRQRISELKKELAAMPDMGTALGLDKQQQLHEAEEALAALNAQLRGTKKEMSELDKLRERLAKMQKHTAMLDNEEYIELTKLINAEKEQQHIKNLIIQMRNNEVNSLKYLEAEYQLYKIALDKVPEELRGLETEMRTIVTVQGEVTMSTKEMAIKMAQLRDTIRLQKESFGDYSMNVGNYARTFDGLTFSIVQVVRELPAATINMNTFFLAISNNIPMVIDEINMVRNSARAAGKEVPSVMKVISGAFKSGAFWLNMVVVILLTFLSKSDAIINFFENLALKIKGTDTQKTLKAINDEVKTGAKEFGKAYTSFISLREGYLRLKTEAEKQTWIKNHKTDFHELGVSVTNLDEAQNLFVEHSDDFVKALLKQAMAAVALKAAQGKLEESFAEYLKGELSIEKMGEYLKEAGYDIGENFGSAVAKGYYDKASAKIKDYEKRFFNERGELINSEGFVIRKLAAPADVKAAYDAQKAYENYGKSVKKANELNQEAVNITRTGNQWMEEYADSLDNINVKQADQEEHLRKTKNLVKDIGKYIDDTHLKITKLYNDIFEAGEEDKLVAQFAKIQHDYEEKGEQLRNTIADVDRKLKANTKTLTADQIRKLQEISQMTSAALVQLKKNYERQQELWQADVNIRAAETLRKRTSAELEATRGDIEASYELRRQIIVAEMYKELQENSKLTEREKIAEADIIAKYNFQLLDLQREYADKSLQIRRDLNDAVLQNTNKYSKEAYKAELDNINIAFTSEVNRILTEAGVNYEGIMSTYNEINAETGTEAANAFLNNYIQALTNTEARNALMKAMAVYQQNVNKATEANLTSSLELQQKLELSTLPSDASLGRSLMQVRHEIESLELQLQMAEEGIIKLDEKEKEIIRNQIKNAQLQIKSLRIDTFAQHGLIGGLLANIAPEFFGDDQLNALEKAKQQIIDSLNEILDAEIQIRQKEKELAEERVSEAKSSYEREIEARNKGYAHNVDTAKKELLLQQKTLQKKQLELEKAERAKAAIDSAMQASSLVTATAELWAAFANMGIPGIILAAVSTAGMFASFIAAKVRAAQLTSNYGEGGLEILRGGSHASGNDIDLHTKNSGGRNMHAEGGEALAIINKRSTAKYRNILPALVRSINDGTYVSRYTDSINNIHNEITHNVNLGRIESSLGTLIMQGKRQVHEFGDTTVIINGNTRTTIRRSN